MTLSLTGTRTELGVGVGSDGVGRVGQIRHPPVSAASACLHVTATVHRRSHRAAQPTWVRGVGSGRRLARYVQYTTFDRRTMSLALWLAAAEFTVLADTGKLRAGDRVKVTLTARGACGWFATTADGRGAWLAESLLADRK